MVLLAAAVCNKSGKALISRQFVEMTRSRIEGLLASFPKLMGGSGKQHTFVETESVRYVYQPLEKLYVLLITTKASNILEDLETLRLFARVIPEYCKTVEESEILAQAFSLIFAFDEIIALGYRENVNLAQIRTFTEMDSHEEKVFQAIRQTQEREAKENMKRKAKELQRQRQDNLKYGRNVSGYSGISGGGGGGGRSDIQMMDSMSSSEAPKPSTYNPAPSKPAGGGRALKLGGGKKDVESFVDQLKSEGEHVSSSTSASKAATAVAKVAAPAINQESVHLRTEEKISLTAGREGGLQNLEVHGLITLKIAAEKYGRSKVTIKNTDTKGVQIQTHPNVDKKLFQTSSVVGLKNPEKPFPINQDVGILKWRFQTQDDAFMPLSINCWPNEVGSKCDVNIEYSLERPSMELNDVVITIPLPAGAGAPVVGDCEGDYRHDSRKNILEWRLPVIDASNKSGSLEFTITGHANDFFPVNVNFVSKKQFCDIEVDDVLQYDTDAPVKFSSEVVLYVDKYEIV